MESYRQMGRLEKSAEVLAAERRSDERFGLQQQLRWVVGEEAVDRYWRGDWETALARVDEFMAEVEAGSPHYQEPVCRWVRVYIALARGDLSGADEDSARNVDLAREQKDLQVLAPVLAQRAVALIALGRSAEASELVDELLALPLHYSSFIDLAWALTDLGRGGEFEQRAADTHSTPLALRRARDRRRAVRSCRRCPCGDGRRRRRGLRATPVGERRPGPARARLLPLRRRDAVHRGGRGAARRHGMNAARRERKVVTVLFADLVGFTSRAESLDPEDVEAILGPYHERLRSELERFGGTVEKFIGDAVMALFGAPVAHEDDAERAVRAALAIRDWAEEEGELEVRIGDHHRGGARLARRPSRGGRREWRRATS